ncbi:MAG TPA: hypothetical protein DIV47_00100 [Candidatus Pacebacteria bacterium]|nr:hypothetical protein [Candidatus Paceibacterota bacterium]
MKINSLALANTFALIDLVLHPLFHLWGWLAPQSYEMVMSEFVIGWQLRVTEQFTPKFFVFWFLEVLVFWFLGYVGAELYNRLNKSK